MAFNSFPAKGGIPSGNTAGRPSGPVIGDTYYNGQLEILEIFNGTIWVASSAPPATPSIATPTDVGTVDYASGGSLSVVFTPGSGGGTPNQYNAYTTAGGFSAFSSNTTVTVSGLTPTTSYIIYGNAQNNFGTTVNTANASAVTVTTKPQAPTIGTATSGGGSDVTVTWTLNATGGKVLSAVKVNSYSGATLVSTTTAATTSSTSLTITGLTNGTTYTFKVFSVNANGDGALSAASNSYTIPSSFSTDYLVVAGGGGAGSRIGGGGGAGGMRCTVTGTGGSGSLESALTLLTATNYTVTVGAGGAGRVGGISGGNGTGTNGVDSVFSTITSAGGGGGGTWTGTAGNAGGSGGGASGDSGGTVRSGGAASPAGQGFAGGTGARGTLSEYGGGGGGGASATGGAGSANGGNGGAGRATSISGTSVTYAGGGGGGVETTNTPGSGGAGGGGNAAGPNNTTDGGAGSPNTGGGGGTGGNTGGSCGAGGAGGSGIVVLRYPDTRTITIGAGLTGSESAASGGYKRATITAGSGNVSWA
jgi:hypothetical protein